MTPRFKEKLVVWQTMVDTLSPKLADMPQFTADHAALGAIVAKARDLESRQDTALAELRDINKQRQAMIGEGTDLRDRLARGLQGVLGPKNVKLVEFGVKPRPQIIRRKRLTKAEKAARDAALAKLASPAPAVAGTAPVSQPAPDHTAKPTTQ